MTDSEETKEASTLITLQLDTGEREFQSLEEVQQWMYQERSYFSWLEKGSKDDGNTINAWNAINQWLNFINQYIQQSQQNQSNPSHQQSFGRNLQSQINHHMQKGHLITSKNPHAIFCKSLSGEEDVVIASYAFANLLDISTNNNSPKALKGAFYAFQYLQGATSTVESHTEALVSMSAEWNGRFNKQHLDIRAKSEAVSEEIDDLKNQFLTLKQEISTQKVKQVTAFAEQINKSEKTLSDIARTYDKKLALQSSVQYWSNKRELHTKVIWWIGGATVLFATLTGGAFIIAALKLLQVTIAEVELWRLGVMLAISTFGIWVTRLSAKIFISNLHLRTDADERVTMMQTYLALLREGSGPAEEERQLILQTLFRPSTTGFIKEDGPSSFHELVTNALSKK